MLNKFKDALIKSNAGNFAAIADCAAEVKKVVDGSCERVFVTPFSPPGLGQLRRELLLSAKLLGLELESFEAVCQKADKTTFANRVRWLGQNIERTLTCVIALQAKLEDIHEPWVVRVRADIERLLAD